jgi:hypothetical protein
MSYRILAVDDSAVSRQFAERVIGLDHIPKEILHLATS